MHNDLSIILPELAYVNIWSYYKLNKVLQEEHMVRVLLTYDGLTYVLTQYYIMTTLNSDQTTVQIPDLTVPDTIDTPRPTLSERSTVFPL